MTPLKNLTHRITQFQENPANSRFQNPQNLVRSNEIGVVDQQFSTMSKAINTILQEQKNLVTLGESISRINHDVRGQASILSLLLEQLLQSPDPHIQKIAGRFEVVVHRIIRFCTQTLTYVNKGRLSLIKGPFNLLKLLEEVAHSIPKIKVDMLDINPLLKLNDDRTQIFRVFDNLFRNAKEASAHTITISTVLTKNFTLYVHDNGPGLPDHIKRDYLFLFMPVPKKRGQA